MSGDSARKLLSQFLSYRGKVPYSDTDSILGFLNPPDHLKSINDVCSNLLQILPLSGKICEAEEGCTEDHLTSIQAWENVCSVLLSLSDNFAAVFPEILVSRQQHDPHPLWGCYDNHPLYVLLSFSPAFPEYKSKFHQLMAQIIIARLILSDKKMQRENPRLYESAMVDTLRKARHVCDSPFLQHLPDNLMTMNEYRNALKKLGKNEFRDSFVKLIDLALGYRDSFTRDETSLNPRYAIHRPAKKATPPSSDDSDPDFEEDDYQFYKFPSSNSKEEQANLLAGYAPGELTSGLALLFEKQKGKQPMGGRTASQQANRGPHLKNILAMNNQRFMGRWNSLTLHEVTAFLDAVSDLQKKKSSSRYYFYGLPANELTALLMAIFLRALPLEQVLKFRIYKPQTSLDKVAAGYIYYGTTRGKWLIKPTIPNLITSLSAEQESQSVRNIEAYYLSSGQNGEQFIDNYIEKELASSWESGDLLFKQSKKKLYIEAVSSFISAVNIVSASRINLNRIEMYLFDKISCQKGSDITIAMLLTGRMHYLGKPALHYTSIKVSTLQEIYWQTCREVFGKYRLESETCAMAFNSDSPFQETSQIKLWGGFTGSQICPEKVVIQKLISTLKQRLQDARQLPWGTDKIRRVHNSLVRYLFIMIGFCTGYRAVCNPFASESQFDMESGFLVISDKDNEEYYNARVVWLPPVCLRQYLFYREHLDNLLPRLDYMNLQAANEIRSIFAGMGHEKSLLFFLNNEDHSLDASPGRVWGNLRDIYTLPENSNRHFLRSTLLSKGCSPGVINAFMGHWERGEEPFGRYSTLSPLSYHHELSKHLVPLIEELGFVAIAGLEGRR